MFRAFLVGKNGVMVNGTLLRVGDAPVVLEKQVGMYISSPDRFLLFSQPNCKPHTIHFLVSFI
jgi:hypothetical protein